MFKNWVFLNILIFQNWVPSNNVILWERGGGSQKSGKYNIFNLMFKMSIMGHF